ncbi:inositol monophosphatase [Acrasis kona]|uniref:3'(2'),5'-bisphosphate nucleotidase 1 n=1 Tax=Acrasis kona TaxID=1008807 RepID=A0AAW2ZMQ2_9EUKA
MQIYKRTFGTLTKHLYESIDIAYKAGSVAQEFCIKRSIHDNGIKVTKKEDTSPVTEVDKQLNEIIVNHLSKQFTDARVVGEESDLSTLEDVSKGMVFFVDPIDGTKEFIQNNGQWSVMIGLALDGEAHLGVVYIPSSDEMFFAVHGHGSYMMKSQISTEPEQRVAEPLCANNITDPSKVINLASRSHYDSRVELLMKKINANKQIQIGSFGIKAAYIASGRADMYVQASGKTSYWDTCGPEVILAEAGAVLLNYKKKRIKYEGTNTRNVDAMIAAPTSIIDKLHEAMCEVYDLKVEPKL